MLKTSIAGIRDFSLVSFIGLFGMHSLVVELLTDVGRLAGEVAELDNLE